VANAKTGEKDGKLPHSFRWVSIHATTLSNLCPRAAISSDHDRVVIVDRFSGQLTTKAELDLSETLPAYVAGLENPGFLTILLDCSKQLAETAFDKVWFEFIGKRD